MSEWLLTEGDNGGDDQEPEPDEPDGVSVNGASGAGVEEVGLLLDDVAQGVEERGDDPHDHASYYFPH